MKACIKHFFGKRVPPLAKVLFYHFGLRGTLIAATRFAILLFVLLLTVVALSRAVSVAGLLLALGLQTVVFCRLGLLEFRGMVLFALGIVQENSSRVSVARKLFLGSLTLLRSRSGAYEALYRTARGKTEMQALVQLMQKKGESLTAQEAFLLARCHGECGDVGAAMSVIERAER